MIENTLNYKTILDFINSKSREETLGYKYLDIDAFYYIYLKDNKIEYIGKRKNNEDKPAIEKFLNPIQFYSFIRIYKKSDPSWFKNIHMMAQIFHER